MARNRVTEKGYPESVSEAASLLITQPSGEQNTETLFRATLAAFVTALHDKGVFTSADSEHLIKNVALNETEDAIVFTFWDDSTKTIAVNTNTDDIYTKEEVNNLLAAINSAIAALRNEVENIEGYTYYATYRSEKLVDGSDDETENVFTLWEVAPDGTETVKSRFQIQGGGGSASNITLTLERVTPSPIVITKGQRVLITVNATCKDKDNDDVDMTYNWKVGNSVVMSGNLAQGQTTFDLTEYCLVGTNKPAITVTDVTGSAVATKVWTEQTVDIRIESSFDDSYSRPAGSNVTFPYTPYGSVNKTVYFKLDGVQIGSVTTQASGTQMYFNVPAHTHGTHLLEAYIVANVNGTNVETPHIFRDIAWYDAESETTLISCQYRNDYYGTVQMKQYDALNIPYSVFCPTSANPTVKLYEDNVLVQELQISASANVWNYKPTVAGSHTLKIACEGTQLLISINAESIGIDIEPITDNLNFDFNPVGRSNSSVNRLWQDENNPNVKMTVSQNFDWVNGGYVRDTNGDACFLVKAGSRAYISHQLFAVDPRELGAEFKVIYKTANVMRADAEFLSCMPSLLSERDQSKPVGLKMNVHNAQLIASTGTLDMPISDNDIIESEININAIDTSDDNAKAYVMSYEDGTEYRPLIFDNSTRFYQYAPAPITIGSDYCDVYIYRMKSYGAALNTSGILNNFIADARNAEEMIARYTRNQIYGDGMALTPDSVANACPHLRIIKIDAPYFTNDKNNFVKNTSVEQIFLNGDPDYDNWKFSNGYHAGQGTTSNEYGEAARNINLYMCMDGEYRNSKIVYDPTYITQLILGDGVETPGGIKKRYTDGKGKITYTRQSVPANVFNIKVNVASSNSETNRIQALRYQRYLSQLWQSPAQKANSKIKSTMEFYNCVVFIRENNTDLSTHREFNDTDWHFYSLGNFGDAKVTDFQRVYDAEDPNEFVVEISDNTFPNSTFPTGTGEYPIAASDWKAGNTAYDNLHNHWDDTYEFRYEMDGITAEQRAANIAKWNEFYEWVITTSNFRQNLKNWFVVESALFFYLFTEHYSMIDNRAKNTFWHWGKIYITAAEAAEMSEEEAAKYTVNDAMAAINGGYRFDFWDYDNDTSLGINNSGELTIPYGKEDIDYKVDGDATSGYIFNAAESTFFRRIREECTDAAAPTGTGAEYSLKSLAKNLDTCFSPTSIINEYDEAQAEFPEELWRLHFERLYERTFNNGTERFLREMMTGRLKYHRRQWVRDQAAYMGTKYLMSEYTADQISFRCNTSDLSETALTVVPFSDMYASVMFGNSTPIQIRAKAGETLSFVCPLADANDTMILIYCASRIQAISDLSGFYMSDNDFSKATRIQNLIIGSDESGYSNSRITTLGIGNNTMLKVLNIKNCYGLQTTVNLSGLENLEEFYAEGTRISGVTFANGGKIVHAHLPATIGSMSIRNLDYITDLLVASYDNLEKLTVENSIIDTLDLLGETIDTLNEISLIGIDWDLNDITLLELIYNAPVSNLEGTVHIDVIRRQYLTKYQEKWNNLIFDIPEGGIVEQYPVTFLNYDQSPIRDTNGNAYVQWVDAGKKAYNPITDLETIEEFATIELAEAYLATESAAAGQIIKVLENGEYKPYVIKQDTTTQTGFALEAIVEVNTPTKPMTEQYKYAFNYWAAFAEGEISDTEYNFGGAVVRAITLIAVYSEALRTFTVKFYFDENHTQLLHQEDDVEYGSEVVFDDFKKVRVFSVTDNVTGINYLESYVFRQWDKSSGFVTDDLEIHAIWRYAKVFKDDNGKVYFPEELNPYAKAMNQMTTAEIAAVAANGEFETFFEDKDHFDFVMGNDYDFANVPSETIVEVDDELYLDGLTPVIPTDSNDEMIRLFGEDAPSFTMVVDYEFTNDVNGYAPANEKTLMSCFENPGNGNEGVRLRYYSNRGNVLWGDKNVNVANKLQRDVLVLRHQKGSNTIYIYAFNGNTTTDNVYGDSMLATSSVRTVDTSTNAPLTFGGVVQYNASTGEWESAGSNYLGAGIIHWCKIWYADLGANVAQSIARWSRDKLREEYFNVAINSQGDVFGSPYILTGTASTRAKASFIANNTMRYLHNMNNTNTNVGGWGGSNMFSFMQNRFYPGIPQEVRSLIAQVKVVSTIGGSSSNTANYDSYVYLPCKNNMDGSGGTGYSDEGKRISWFTKNARRAKFRNVITEEFSPDGVRHYQASGLPKYTGSTNPVNTYGLYDETDNPGENAVREYDIWQNANTSNNENTGTAYIYLTAATMKKWNCTPSVSVTDQTGTVVIGGWVSANNFWLVSPYTGGSYIFWSVYYNGTLNYSNGAGITFAVCPCFSIYVVTEVRESAES